MGMGAARIVQSRAPPLPPDVDAAAAAGRGRTRPRGLVGGRRMALLLSRPSILLWPVLVPVGFDGLEATKHRNAHMRGKRLTLVDWLPVAGNIDRGCCCFWIDTRHVAAAAIIQKSSLNPKAANYAPQLHTTLPGLFGGLGLYEVH